MKDPVREELHHRILWTVVRSGAPVRDKADVYQWIKDTANEDRDHVLACGISLEVSEWHDGSWREFIASEVPDLFKSGVDALVTCRCGFITAQLWRYAGTPAAFLRRITSGTFPPRSGGRRPAPLTVEAQKFPCGQCGALPGKACRTVRSHGRYSKPGMVTAPHVSRLRQVRTANQEASA